MITDTLFPKVTETALKRIGFSPDILVNVVGSSYEGRQSILKKAAAFSGMDDTPPIFLERELDNPYDPGAVKVMVGIDYDTATGWAFSQAGYTPAQWTIPIKDPSGNTMWDGDTPTRKVLHELLDEDPAQVLVGLEGVYRVATNWGMRLGLAHRHPSILRVAKAFVCKKIHVVKVGPDRKASPYYDVGSTVLNKFYVVESTEPDGLVLHGELQGQGTKTGTLIKTSFFVPSRHLDYYEPLLDEKLISFLADTNPENFSYDTQS
jgi:hypothetical protein